MLNNIPILNFFILKMKKVLKTSSGIAKGLEKYVNNGNIILNKKIHELFKKIKQNKNLLLSQPQSKC